MVSGIAIYLLHTSAAVYSTDAADNKRILNLNKVCYFLRGYLSFFLIISNMYIFFLSGDWRVTVV